MNRIKKILIVLIIIVFLEGLAIISLYQRWQMNMDLINDLANRSLVASNLISNLQKQILEIKSGQVYLRPYFKGGDKLNSNFLLNMLDK